MAKACPNISSEDWKRLVAEHGLEGAIKRFIQNGYEVPVSVKQDPMPRLIGDKYSFNGTAVMQKLYENPKLALKVLQSLKKQFPLVEINEDGLFDKDGNWVQVEPGQRGMHMRNAFISAVAFGNEAIIETIPHEFAHEYIQMFRNNPLVLKAMRSKSEEELADELGKFYAGKKSASWLKSLLDDITYLLRSVFGNVDTSEILAREFYKGRKLGAETAGEGYVSYQNAAAGKKRVQGTFNPDPAIPRTDVSQLLMPFEKIKSIYQNQVIPEFIRDDQSFDYDGFHRYLNTHINNARWAQEGLNKKSKVDVTMYNHVELDVNILKDLYEFITNSDGSINEKNLAIIRLYLEGKINMDKYPPDTQRQINTLNRVHQSIGFHDKGIPGYQEIVADNIFAEEDKMVLKEAVASQVREEFNEKINTKESFFQNLSARIPDQLGFLKKLDLSKISPWLYDGYLLSKSLTRKTGSAFQSLFYDSLNNATTEFHKTQVVFRELTTLNDKKVKYNNWGTADQQGKTIDDYETYEIQLINGESVKLTKSEAMNLFLMFSQEDTNAAITEHGIYLDEDIKGRNTKFNVPLKISVDSRRQLIKDFTNDKEYSDVVNSVRSTMTYLHSRVNPTFRQLNGYDLEQRQNYFPAYYGKVNLDQRKEKNSIETFRSAHARLGGDMPVRIGDFKKIMNNTAVSSGMYGAFALPIRNNRIILNSLRSDYKGTSIESRLDIVEGYLNKLEDPTMLYSSQGEKQIAQWINDNMSNFSVFALGYNPFVFFKQTASYMAAKEYIPAKFLKEAGSGVGPVMIPKLRPFFQALAKRKMDEDIDTIRKILPVEFRLSEENPTYQEITRNSYKLKHRFEGHVNRELSEAIMNTGRGKDIVTVKLPGSKKGFKFSKSRAMEGIRVMDAVNVFSMWNAVKLWTDSQIASGELQITKDSPEYWEHVAVTTEFAIERTQATSDIINRSVLSTESNPIARGITMFSSDAQKLGMLAIERVMDYNNNPTVENKKKLMHTMASTMLMNAVYITAIDMIRAVLMGYGMDDDKEAVNFAKHNIINNMAGYFHVFGTVVRMISSRIDDQPWKASTQHPMETLVDDIGDTGAYLLKGDFPKAMKEALDVFLKVKGIPGFPIKTPMTLYKNYGQ